MTVKQRFTRTLCVAACLPYLMVSRAGVGLVVLMAWLDGLFSIDQVGEVTFGIAESIVVAPDYQATFRWLGWIHYGSFWLATLLLAVATEHTMRWQLTSGNDSVRAWPFRLPAFGRPLDLSRALLPRAAAITVVGGLHLAYVTEAITLLGKSKVMLAVVLFAGAWVLVACAVLVASKGLKKRRGRALAVGALSVVTVAGAWLGAGMLGLELRLSVTLSILTTAAFGSTIVLVRRSAPAPGSTSPRPILEWLVFALVMTLYVALWTPWSVHSWRVGTLAIALVALAVATYALGAFVLLLRHVDRRGAAIGAALIAGSAIALAWSDQEKLGHETLEVPTDQAAAPPPVLPLRTSASGPGRDLAIHADGGGIRAALFTASVLALADDMTCGEFGELVRVASGVSGGSVGIAAWAGLREDYVRHGGAWKHCVPQRHVEVPRDLLSGRASFGAGQFPLTFRVRYMLAQDHLSPIVAAMVTRDLLPHWWTSKAARGQALVESWQNAARQVVLSQQPERDDTPPVGLAEPLAAVTAGSSHPPLLAFSATDVRTGQPVIFTNAPWRLVVPPDRVLQLGVAALHSARFPIVSPAGALADGTRVVDGGYYDNSGASTLELLLREGSSRTDASSHPYLPKHVALIRINGNAPAHEDWECEQRLREGEHAFLTTMVESLGNGNHAFADRRLAQLVVDRKKAEEVQAKANAKADASWSGLAAVDAARTAHADRAVADLIRQRGETDPESNLPNWLTVQLSYAGASDEVCKTATKEVCRQLRLMACAANARPAPLGWHVTQLTAGSMQWSELVSAGRILSMAGLANDPVK